MNKKIKRYIDQEDWINRLKEEREETTNEKRKLYLTTLINAIDCRPTVDEKEIIRKTMERILTRLKKEHLYPLRDRDFNFAMREDNVIRIVKEEGGIE